MKEPKEYKFFVYSYEGMLAEEDATNQAGNQQQVSVATKSHPMNVKLNSGTELHLDAELQNGGVAHSDSRNSTHERDAKILDRDIHSDSEVKRKNEETRVDPRLSKYVKRHHPIDKIIRNKDARPMKRNILRSE